MSTQTPVVIVLGNEKGGTGKSTTAMHIIVALLRKKKRVGSIDLDSRQASLTRYVDNRCQFKKNAAVNIPVPHHIRLVSSEYPHKLQAEQEDTDQFNAAFNELAQKTDYIIIDCPGSDRFLSHLAHQKADILITPLNDSFIDLDLLATVDGENLKIIRPSHYSEMVWKQRQKRAIQGNKAIEWFVMRNRLSNIDARNKRHMNEVLEKLSKRLNFTLIAGFGERVIFREMFLQGLTLLDFSEKTKAMSMTLSHVAARQEIHALIHELNIA